MKSEIELHHHHAVIAMVIGFAGSFLFFFASLLPSYYDIGQFLEEISVALYLFGCTVHGLKLTEQKKTMPAAGFTMMAIAQGVIFTTYFEPNNLEGNSQAYELFNGGLLLFLPAMILIAFYTRFPKWVNWMGIFSCIPFLVNSIIFVRIKHYVPALDNIYLVAQILLESTALVWAYFIWKNYQEELKRGNADK